MPPVSRHGHWSKPRRGWRLGARPPTTFPNLRVTGKPLLIVNNSFFAHSSTQPETQPLYPRPLSTRTRSQGYQNTKHDLVVLTMIQKTKIYVGPLKRTLPRNSKQKHQLHMLYKRNILRQATKHPARNEKLAHTRIFCNVYACRHSPG